MRSLHLYKKVQKGFGFLWQLIFVNQTVFFQKKEIKENLNYECAVKRATLKYYNCISAICEPGESLLEVACGPGRYVALFHALGMKVTGVDIHSYKEWQLFKDHHSISLQAGVNAEVLPFAENSFDSAVCIGALFYFDKPLAALKELARVVKPGGKILVSTVNSSSGHIFAHRLKFRVDSSEQFEHTLNALNLKVEEKFYYGYSPSRLNRLWSYIYYCFLPIQLYDFLDKITPKSKKPVMTFICTKVTA